MNLHRKRSSFQLIVRFGQSASRMQRIIVSVSPRHSGGVGERRGLSKEGKKEIRHSAGRPGWTQQWPRINIITVRFGCRGRSADEGQVLYSNASRGGASEHRPKARRGCPVPRGRTEVEGCRLTVGTAAPFAGPKRRTERETSRRSITP